MSISSPRSTSSTLIFEGAEYPAIWLRDNCPCPDCAVPGSGQKLFNVTDLPESVGIAESGPAGDAIRVLFHPESHESHFPAAWLAEHRPAKGVPTAAPPDDRTEDAKALWEARDLAGDQASSSTTAVPASLSAQWSDFAGDPGERARCLDALLRFGFVLLRGVPLRDRAVLDVAKVFGYVRETNYGEVFEVRVEQNPANLAFSSLPITPHTDNPYRDPVPTIQLLHCLRNAAEGGDSGLVDGFHAAAVLRREQPEAFAVLTGTQVTFRYADEHADLSATVPMIGLDAIGRIKQIRFNNRSLRPVTLSSASAKQTEEFYDAYRAFARLLYRPEAQLNFRLEPGDCVIFDNTRALHARTGFTASGERHLQGCYADLDSAASALNVLRRELSKEEVVR